MEEKFLPIGSVVILKDATKRIMITGYLSIDQNNKDVVYDYNGCVFPEGFLTSTQVLLFNHDQIKEIFFRGYVDSEQHDFANRLNQLGERLLNEK